MLVVVYHCSVPNTPKQRLLQSLNGPPTARPTNGTSLPKINDTAAQRDGGC